LFQNETCKAKADTHFGLNFSVSPPNVLTMGSKNNALVVFSGGQDSTTCLAIAIRDCTRVETVTFDYGQRHRIELEQARLIANLAGSKKHHEIDMAWLGTLTENALTRPDIPITHLAGELPSTFVAGRNLFFLSIAAVIAKQRDIQLIYTGVCETDFSGYPDCRHDFITSLNQTINIGMDCNIEIRTPLMNLNKSETVILMRKLGKLDWYALSHTCYEGVRPACGSCPACKLRIKGFNDAGIPDPLEYNQSN